MRGLPAPSLGFAAALALAAGCGGGGGKKATTTSATPVAEETTTSVEVATTTTTIDPSLQALLLVAADLPGFKDPTIPTPSNQPSTTCDPADVPGVTAIIEAPGVNGTTLVKEANDAVKVSSRVVSVTPDQAQGSLTELLDPKAASCLESDLRAVVEKEQPAGTTVTLKLTTSQSTAAGADQVVILGGTATVKGDTVTRTLRHDIGFLRAGGTVLVVTYSGPSSSASTAERQGIVVTAAGKLSASTTSTTVGAAGGSTSSTRRTSTTRRRSTTTTMRRATTTSSTQKATTTTPTTGATP